MGPALITGAARAGAGEPGRALWGDAVVLPCRRDWIHRGAYSDPIEPEDEWEDPALLLRLMRAGCPITDVGTAQIDACIELHFDDETTPWRALAITPGEPSVVELHGEAASLALQALL